MFEPENYKPMHFDNVRRYTTGGLPAINIGDLLKDRRYQVTNMLGQGGYSNVWLAQDTQNHCYVALKTIAAKKSPFKKDEKGESNDKDKSNEEDMNNESNEKDENNELKILQHINANADAQHPGRKHLPRLLDHFWYDGPNGRSLVLVLERLGPSSRAMLGLHLKEPRHDLSVSRSVCRQLLLAVDCLHACGIAHGDIHTDNILFYILPTQEEMNFLKPDARDVKRKDGGPLEQGVPRQLVEPMQYTSEECEQLSEIQLADFSNAFFISDPPATVDTIEPQLPPETLFKKPLTKAVDIWGLACTTYELVCGRALFPLGLGEDRRCLVSLFYNHFGESCASWLLVHLINAMHSGVWEEWPRGEHGKFFYIADEEFIPLWKYLFGDFSREYDDPRKSEDVQGQLRVLERYLLRMFVVDPKGRPDTKALLEDKWVQESKVAHVDV